MRKQTELGPPHRVRSTTRNIEPGACHERRQESWQLMSQTFRLLQGRWFRNSNVDPNNQGFIQMPTFTKSRVTQLFPCADLNIHYANVQIIDFQLIREKMRPRKATSKQICLETSGYLNHLIQKTSTNPRRRIHPELRTSKTIPQPEGRKREPCQPGGNQKKTWKKESGISVKYIGIWISFLKNYLSEANPCFSNINMWIKFWYLHSFTPLKF